MPLDDDVQELLGNSKNNGQTHPLLILIASHLTDGRKLQRQGLLREAIQEFAKENNRPVVSSIDAEIAESSYWHIGMIYKELGEIENAKSAFQKALALWNEHHVGVSPHDDLAEIFMQQGDFDESIKLCNEVLAHIPATNTKRLLAKALEMKKSKNK